MTGRQHRTGGPVLLSDLFDHALDQLQATQPQQQQRSPAQPPLTQSRATDSFLFSGNRHDSVPRALLLDRRLTPLERNAWQVFRLMLEDDGVTALPTYDQLAPWLASMPCASRASHETVARALTLLRLTRWISLARHRRDPRTGRILGNLYVLHDEPLTPFEAIQLDADYLELIGQALTHASKTIQRVAVTALQELTQDPMLLGQMLPSRLEVLLQRLTAQGWQNHSNYPQDIHNHDSEDGCPSHLRNQDDPTSESEVGRRSPQNASLRNPKTSSTVELKEENIKEVRTVPREPDMLRLPERFLRLKAEQQSGALAAIQSLDADLHQPLLDEWDVRCNTGGIRNPAGYLFGLIQKAMRGEFRAWAAKKASAAAARNAPPPGPSPIAPVDPEVAKVYVARLRELLRSS